MGLNDIRDRYVGLPLWDVRKNWHVQTNNPTEEMLRKQGLELAQELATAGVKLSQEQQRLVLRFLESCGGSSAATLGFCAGAGFDLRCPGGYSPQVDELIVDYLNDPRNYPQLLVTGQDPRKAPGNRQAVFYQVVGREVFDLQVVYSLDLSPVTIRRHLRAGNGVQACLSPPGHYVAVVALDLETDELIYHDSWPTRKPEWAGDGFARRMTKDEEAALVYEGNVWMRRRGAP